MKRKATKQGPAKPTPTETKAKPQRIANRPEIDAEHVILEPVVIQIVDDSEEPFLKPKLSPKEIEQAELKKSNRRKPWSAKEIAFLKANWGVLPLDQISDQLMREVSTVMNQGRKYRLGDVKKINPDRLFMKEVSAHLARDTITILRACSRLGITPEKLPRRQFYQFTQEQLQALEAHFELKKSRKFLPGEEPAHVCTVCKERACAFGNYCYECQKKRMREIGWGTKYTKRKCQVCDSRERQPITRNRCIVCDRAANLRNKRKAYFKRYKTRALIPQ